MTSTKRLLMSTSQLLVFFVFCCISPTHASYPEEVCSLLGQEPLALRRNETSGDFYVDAPPTASSHGNETGTRRLLRRATHAFSLATATAGRHLQEEGDSVVKIVRSCPCAFSLVSVYCEIQHDICEVTTSGRHLCWTGSGHQFIGNLFPFVFFWLLILLVVLFCTRRGKDAKAYMIRRNVRVCCCLQDEEIEQDRSLNRALDQLLLYNPERVVQMARVYRSRTRQRRHRDLQQAAAAAGGNSATITGLTPEGQSSNNINEGQREGVIEAMLQPNLTLKTRKYRAKHSDHNEENDEDENLCIICLGSIEDGSRVGSLLSCDHDFHVDCLKDWLKRKNHCPLCNERAAELRFTTGVGDSGVAG